MINCFSILIFSQSNPIQISGVMSSFIQNIMTSPNGNIFRVTVLCAENSPHKVQWRGALMSSWIYVWINDWGNNREAGDLRRYRAHYGVIVKNWDYFVHSIAKWNLMCWLLSLTMTFVGEMNEIQWWTSSTNCLLYEIYNTISRDNQHEHNICVALFYLLEN